MSKEQGVEPVEDDTGAKSPGMTLARQPAEEHHHTRDHDIDGKGHTTHDHGGIGCPMDYGAGDRR